MSAPTIWNIDPVHTNVEFAVRHLMISIVKGRFGDVKGAVELDSPIRPRSAGYHHRDRESIPGTPIAMHLRSAISSMRSTSPKCAM
jgi:hypothetical protein